jgi:uncharacterized protein (TIGR02246 family)
MIRAANRLFVRALIAFGVCSGVSQAGVAQTPMQCAPISAAIVEAQFARFTDAWATGSAEQAADLFAPDAVLLATVSNRPRTTHADIVDYFEHFLAAKPVARLDSSTIRLGCNSAARFGTWTIDLTDASTGAKSVVPARYSFIYKFQDGQWWIDNLHSSKMPETVPAH